jgi:hypothetical protein
MLSREVALDTISCSRQRDTSTLEGENTVAIRPTKRKLTEAELNAPDLDDDGNLDVEHYPLPDSSGIKDPALAAAWDEMLEMRKRREVDPEDDDDDD